MLNRTASGLLVIAIVVAGCHAVFLESAEQNAVFVATDGCDTNPGTLDKPFATFEAARDAVRRMKQNGECPDSGITIYLRGGIYRRLTTFELNEQDSGALQAPIVWRPYKNESVAITGGITISSDAFERVKEPKIIERLVPAAREKIRMVNLKTLGVIEIGELGPRGFRRPYRPAPVEVFVNGEPMRISRWPNEGAMTIAEVIDPGSIPRGESDLLNDGDYSNRGGLLRYDSDRPDRWTRANDIWLSGLFHYGYADDTVKIAELDTRAKTIKTQQPHMYGFKCGEPWQYYFVMNLLEEIDLPGEYYIDRDSGTLYLYPTADLTHAQIQVSLLEEPMIAMEGASHVVFQGMTFEVSRGTAVYMERGSENRMIDCTFRNLGMLAVQIGMGIKPFDVYQHNGTGTPVSRQMGSIHEHIYENSTFNSHGGEHHGMISCDIYNTGAGGISLGGGDRKTLTPAGNYVVNCDIYDFNRWDQSYRPGVLICGVGNRIQHCHIHHCPNTAVLLHGNDHLIEFNEFDHTLLIADDLGVFYLGRDPSELGNIVRYNFFHHNGSLTNDDLTTYVLHLDDGSCGVTVFGNVMFQNNHETGINGGYNHRIINNIFVDNRNTASKHAGIRNGWDTEKWYEKSRELLFNKRLREDLDITQPPYSTRYPQLLKTYSDPPETSRGNIVWNNVFIRSGSVVSPRNDKENPNGNWLLDNYVSKEDPGFVDPASMNFQLRDDSIVYEKIPEFKRIPFEKMGLYSDQYRTITVSTNH